MKGVRESAVKCRRPQDTNVAESLVTGAPLTRAVNANGKRLGVTDRRDGRTRLVTKGQQNSGQR